MQQPPLPSPSSSPGAPAVISAPRPRRLLRLTFAALLGLATTLALATALAAWLPLDRAGGTVAIDGDHLQPWLLHLERPGADRLIWFEKGRVYSRPGIGPPNASSSAVSNWSFATATRNNPLFTKATIAIPEELRAHIDRTPQSCWATALDRRGWPLRALECVIVAPTSPTAPSVYLVHGGALDDRQIQRSTALATVRVFPWRPVWPGLFADTALFASAWYLILSLTAYLSAGGRAALRLRRGHCPACGYDLLGDLAGGCPECGWQRTPHPAAAPSDTTIPAATPP